MPSDTGRLPLLRDVQVGRHLNREPARRWRLSLPKTSSCVHTNAFAASEAGVGDPAGGSRACCDGRHEEALS